MTTAPEQDVRTPLSQEETLSRLGRYEYGWADSDIAGASAQRGLSEAVVRDISAESLARLLKLDCELSAGRLDEHVVGELRNALPPLHERDRHFGDPRPLVRRHVEHLDEK